MTREGTGARFVRDWLPVLAYVAVIFAVSSQPRLEPPFRFPDADKVAHLVEYGLLGILLVRALRSHRRWRAPLAGGLLALALGMGVAVADETYQALVPGRESSVYDWFADTTGLLLAQVAYLLVRRD